MKRVERMWLKPSDDLHQICHQAKNLYNEAMYNIRQKFFTTGRWVRYKDLAFTLKNSENYQALPTKTSQQILLQVDKTWRGFFNATKAYKKHPEEFLSRPRPPRYKQKNGEYLVIFTNQQARIKNGLLILPKETRSMLSVKVRPLPGRLMEVRLIPKSFGYVLEIVYEINANSVQRNQNTVAGIDLGLRNLATIVDNTGKRPVVIKGGAVKSLIQFYHREQSRLQSIYDLQDIPQGRSLLRLRDRYDRKMHDYLHKTSRTIIKHLDKQKIGLLIIGYNKEWQQQVNLGRKTNQMFTGIPYAKFIKMLIYKAEEIGIEIRLQDESHTSKCSFFDDELVEHHKIYVGKRKSGLFRTSKGHIVNADVNGAFNILKKAVPNAVQRWMADGIEDAVRHPVRLAVPI